MDSVGQQNVGSTYVRHRFSTPELNCVCVLSVLMCDFVFFIYLFRHQNGPEVCYQEQDKAEKFPAGIQPNRLT